MSTSTHHHPLRLFIGPLPDNVASTHLQNQEENLSTFIKQHAIHYFLQQGGKYEDWNDDEETTVRKEMLRRWHNSDWSKFKRNKEKKIRVSKWVGSSFVIGRVLGLDVFTLEKSSISPPVTATETRGESSALSVAGSELLPDSVESHPITISSSTPLFHQQNHPNGRQSELVPSSPIISASMAPNLKGKGIATEPSNTSYVAESLTRPGTHHQVAPLSPKDVPRRDKEIFMRDRMVVRVGRSSHENIGKHFDEAEARITVGLEYEEFAEFLVVWKKSRLELYEDQGWMRSRKKLAFTIPLHDNRTRISLFSFVDMSFSLICPPTRLGRRSAPQGTQGLNRLLTGSRGLNVFVFKPKTRSRAVDWFWFLWKELGGAIPNYIDVQCPAIDSRVRISIPPQCSDFTKYNRGQVLEKASSSLGNVPDWKSLLEQTGTQKRVELCWRSGSNLDWIWLTDDVEGNRRECDVLYGVSLKALGRHASLEVRIADFSPPYVALEGGAKLDEPAPIEGYLHRIKSNGRSKTLLYLCTHEGLLFSLTPSRARPPPPPGSSALRQPQFQEAELRRCQSLVLNADAVCDIRSIVDVRRAWNPHGLPLEDDHRPDFGHPVAGGVGNGNSKGRNDWPELDRTGSDEEDEGGEEILSNVKDKSGLRLRRSFEIVMHGGGVVRFETFSRKTALEWVSRLRELVRYWSFRSRVDATDEMDLIHLSTGKQKITTPKHRDGLDHTPEPPADPNRAAAHLNRFWNWCVLEGCRPIVKHGRMYIKKGLRGQYRHMETVLVSGCLVHFDLRKGVHVRRAYQTTNLLDAYVCSGHNAALALLNIEYDPNAPPLPRVFQDGLEANEVDEDTLLVIWYKKQPVDTSLGEPARDPTPPVPSAKVVGDDPRDRTPIPGLSSKRKFLVCRARSKLERDAWCWAINSELERLVRATRGRENKMRTIE